MPKGYKPNEVDSSIYKTAANTLEYYRNIRTKYVTPTGIEAIKLWIALQKK
jgi:hypothetical protein